MRESDPRIDLQLPVLGVPREQLLRDVPDCAESLNAELSECRFHRSIGDLPLSKQCQNGCTWRTYEFTAGKLSRVHIAREVYDASPEFVAAFTEEANIVAEALRNQVGTSPATNEDLAAWNEAATHGEWIVLSQQQWNLERATLTWKLLQAPGHHAGVLLHIDLLPAT